MAEGGRDEGQANSLSVGYDVTFDFFCELCYDEGSTVEAEGYCEDCEEYLCGVCFSGHKRTRQTRHHTMVDKASMPKDSPLTVNRLNRNISLKCSMHSSKCVEFYCKCHKEFGCSVCFVANHRNCLDIESILEKSESIFESDEFQDFTSLLNSIREKSHELIEKVTGNIAQATSNIQAIKQSVRKLKEDVIATMEKLENDLNIEADALVAEEEKNMTDLNDTLNNIADTAGKVLSETDDLRASRRVCQLYISMKKHQDQLLSIQNKLHTSEERAVVGKYRFEPASDFLKLTQNDCALGKINSERNIDDSDEFRDACNDCSTSGKAPEKAILLGDIDVTHDSDRRACRITGSAVLSNDRLIITDFNNNSVKLLDTQTNSLLCTLNLPEAPWDVAVSDCCHVAVALPVSQRIILITTTSDKLAKKSELSVGSSWFRGVAYSKNRLFVTWRVIQDWRC